MEFNCIKNDIRGFCVKGPVWLIDDMDSVLDIISLFLEREGFSTVTFNCPLKALHDIEQGEKPQLIISDYSMPGMTGTEFLIAAQTIIPNVPAIIITGDPDAVPLMHQNIPIIEKGDINFIKNLLTKIENIGTGLSAAKNLNAQTPVAPKKRSKKRGSLSKSKKNISNKDNISFISEYRS